MSSRFRGNSSMGPEQPAHKKPRVQNEDKTLAGQDFQLFDALAALLNTVPISIEILPGDGSEWRPADTGAPASPFLFIEGNLGVPQKWLHKFYRMALPIFSTARKNIASLSDSIVKDLSASSAIILLANPAHQTALNARKRLIMHNKLDVEKELELTAALLSTKDGSKQSILWHHRAWLLPRLPITDVVLLSKHPSTDDRFKQLMLSWSKTSLSLKDPPPLAPPAPPLPPFTDLPGTKLSPKRLEHELGLTARACEAYPRNYHAWAHRRRCLEIALASRTRDPHCPSTALVMAELSVIRRWIEQHISDHSAVCYMGVLLEAFSMDPEPCKPCGTDSESNKDEDDDDDDEPYPIRWPKNTSMPLDHAWSLLSMYPDHQSLWMSLRQSDYSNDSSFIDKFVRGWALGERLPTSFSAETQRWIQLEALKFFYWKGIKNSHFSFDEDESVERTGYKSSPSPFSDLVLASSFFAGKVAGLTESMECFWGWGEWANE
ncbi:hypothetical protein PLICRDRAFT_50528 [Plicaturopsis crispa FD-325 SS-3]|nr:hypothetical protein PLICRDRAFT_50528 [Plicaturopsis crispa FD-325 SS-3]